MKLLNNANEKKQRPTTKNRLQISHVKNAACLMTSLIYIVTNMLITSAITHSPVPMHREMHINSTPHEQPARIRVCSPFNKPPNLFPSLSFCCNIGHMVLFDVSFPLPLFIFNMPRVDRAFLKK